MLAERILVARKMQHKGTLTNALSQCYNDEENNVFLL